MKQEHLLKITWDNLKITCQVYYLVSQLNNVTLKQIVVALQCFGDSRLDRLFIVVSHTTYNITCLIF